jgi:hypothetical protein
LTSRFRPKFFASRGRALRRSAALYLAGFWLAAVFSPHQHVNPVADLLSDGRSDSGVVCQVDGPSDPLRGVEINPVRLIDDDPCPACFSDDFAGVAGHWLAHAANLEILREAPEAPTPAALAVLPDAPASRSPPRAV